MTRRALTAAVAAACWALAAVPASAAPHADGAVTAHWTPTFWADHVVATISSLSRTPGTTAEVAGQMATAGGERVAAGIEATAGREIAYLSLDGAASAEPGPGATCAPPAGAAATAVCRVPYNGGNFFTQWVTLFRVGGSTWEARIGPRPEQAILIGRIRAAAADATHVRRLASQLAYVGEARPCHLVPRAEVIFDRPEINRGGAGVTVPDGGAAGACSAGTVTFSAVPMLSATLALGVVPPASSSGPTPGRQRDTTAPVITRARLSRRNFAPGRTPTDLSAYAAAVRRGTDVHFRVSEPATVDLLVQRRSGRRWRRAGGLNRQYATAGAKRIAFSGRLGGRRPLWPGRYRMLLSARDVAGNRSEAPPLAFRVVRR